MELEEAKKYMEIIIKTLDIKSPNINTRNVSCLKKEAIETVLQALKDKQKDSITINKKDLKEKINTLRKYRKIGNLSELGKMKLDTEISILEGLFEGFF